MRDGEDARLGEGARKKRQRENSIAASNSGHDVRKVLCVTIKATYKIYQKSVGLKDQTSLNQVYQFSTEIVRTQRCWASYLKE
jgi:hypothetical protein